MKIIRLHKEDLRMGKDAIRKVFELDSKDKDNEIYRILVPIVPNTTYLPNIVETFVESKNNVKNFDNKYSFHCANHDVIAIIKQSIMNGSISDYREFEMPTMNNEG